MRSSSVLRTALQTAMKTENLQELIPRTLGATIPKRLHHQRVRTLIPRTLGATPRKRMWRMWKASTTSAAANKATGAGSSGCLVEEKKRPRKARPQDWRLETATLRGCEGSGMSNSCAVWHLYNACQVLFALRQVPFNLGSALCAPSAARTSPPAAAMSVQAACERSARLPRAAPDLRLGRCRRVWRGQRNG